MDLKTFRGVEIRVSDDGTFHGRVGAEHLSADTLKALEAQIVKRKTRLKRKIAIPFSILGWGWQEKRFGHGHYGCDTAVTDAVLTGLHSNGNLIIRYEPDPGRKGAHQKDRWSRTTMVRRLTADEKSEWVELETAKNAAAEAVRHFEQLRTVDLMAEAKRLLEGGDAPEADVVEDDPDDDPRPLVED